MNRLLPALLTVAALIVTIGIVTLNMSWQEISARLTSLDADSIILLLLLTVATRLPQAEALRRALPARGKALRFSDSFWAISIKALFNQLLSGAGLLAQGLRLKRLHGIGVGDFASATWVQFLAQVLAVGLGGLAATVFLIAQHDTPSFSLLLTPWLALLLFGGALMFMPGRLTRFAWFRRRIPENASALLAHRGDFARLVLLQFVVLAIRLARLAVIIAALAPLTEPGTAILAFMIGEFALVFPVTPGGIGFRELLLGLGSIGGAGETMILAGLVDRAAALIVTASLGIVGSFHWRQSGTAGR